MNEEQEEHLLSIKAQFNNMVDKKFRKGAEEHGTVLNKDYTKEQLLDEAINEAIDQVTYLLTLKEKL